MKTVITNTQMSNGGDAAILYAIVETMRRAHLDPLDITIIDPLPHVARRHYPEFEFLQAARYALDRHLGGPFRRLGGVVNNLRDRRLSMARRRRLRTGRPDGLLGPVERAALSAYESADLVISTGGTYLVDNYDISGRLFELELVALAGKAPVFYTQSLGPFHKPGLADALRRHFEASPLILLRDQRSREALRRLGIPDDKLHVLADCVFAMASPDDLDRAAKAQTDIRRVAVSVRNWTFFEGGDSRDGMRNYMGGIADAVERLVRTHGCDVVFLSTCQGIPEYWAKDSAVAARIVEALPQAVRSRVQVDHGFHTPFALKSMLSAFDLVIATRMHMGILALSSGIPVLPIAYEFKTTELFNRLGMGSWVTPIESVAAPSFAARLDDFIASLPAIRAPLFAAVEREWETAMRAGALVAGITPHRAAPAMTAHASRAAAASGPSRGSVPPDARSI